MKLRFTRRAQRHLDVISQYISERNPAAAGALAGTRELVVPGLLYIVVHRIDGHDEAVTVLGVYHGAQVRPGQQMR